MHIHPAVIIVYYYIIMDKLPCMRNFVEKYYIFLYFKQQCSPEVKIKYIVQVIVRVYNQYNNILYLVSFAYELDGLQNIVIPIHNVHFIYFIFIKIPV